MKDSKLNINREPLSEEDFKKAENFNEVLEKYNAAAGAGNGSGGDSGGGFFKSPWFWMAGGAAIITVLLYFGLNTDSSESDNQDIAEMGLIAPPIEGLDIEASNYTVQANMADTIDHNGSRIIVPQNAFLDDNGNLVDGTVDMYYREFHSLTDILISGIPMTYDSLNARYTFESAGMFELRAMKDGKPVFTNPEAPIEVQLNSRNNGNYFNKYFLNEETGKWEYIDRDVALIDSLSAIGTDGKALAQRIEALEKRIDSLEREKPQPPARRNPALYSIKLEVDESQFPELAVYGDVLFQVIDGDDDFQNKYGGIEWDDVELSKGDGDQYLLTFYKDMEPFAFNAIPVMDDATYQSAVIDFEARYAAFEQEYASRMEQDSIEYAALKSRAKFLIDSTDNINYLNSDEYRASLAAMAMMDNVKRSFVVRNFGIYNSDYPQSIPEGRILAIEHFINKDNEEDTLQIRSAHLADHDLNVLVSQSLGKGGVKYDPTHKTTLVVITTNNKMGVYYPEDFAKLQSTELVDMNLTVMTAPKTPLEAEALLKL